MYCRLWLQAVAKKMLIKRSQLFFRLTLLLLANALFLLLNFQRSYFIQFVDFDSNSSRRTHFPPQKDSAPQTESSLETDLASQSKASLQTNSSPQSESSRQRKDSSPQSKSWTQTDFSPKADSSMLEASFRSMHFQNHGCQRLRDEKLEYKSMWSMIGHAVISWWRGCYSNHNLIIVISVQLAYRSSLEIRRNNLVLGRILMFSFNKSLNFLIDRP